MYDVLRSQLSDQLRLPSDAPSVNCELRRNNLWLFTDPVARHLYAKRKRLGQLKHDIQAHVMRNHCWAAEELALAREILRLVHTGVLWPKGTFGYLSPHPPVYRAVREDVLTIDGQKYHFRAGNDLVFVPWLARASSPGLSGPVKIGRLQTVTDLCLCCEAFPFVSTLCSRAIAHLQKTVPDNALSRLTRHP